MSTVSRGTVLESVAAAGMKFRDQKQLEEDRVVSGHLIEGSQVKHSHRAGQALTQGADAEAMGAAYRFTQSAVLENPGPPAQGGITHNKLGHPTLIIEQIPFRLANNQILQKHSQLGLPSSQMAPACVNMILHQPAQAPSRSVSPFLGPDNQEPRGAWSSMHLTSVGRKA